MSVSTSAIDQSHSPLSQWTKPWMNAMFRFFVCMIGLALYASNPIRDLWFYEDVASHEGFNSTADTFIIVVAGQVFVTVAFFPLAACLICYGIGCSQRMTFRPRLDQFTWIWGTISTVIALLMLWMELEFVFYYLTYWHHFDTFLLSASYVGFIYFWWCCSVSHRISEKSPNDGVLDLFEL